MNILIIGATGQIGEAILKKLLHTDYGVSILVRQDLYHTEGKILVVKASEFNRTAFRRALSSADHVIYCLGKPEQFVFEKGCFSSINIDLMKVFIDELIAAGKKSLTYMSTYEVFQAARTGTIVETSPVSVVDNLSEYFTSMIKAYEIVKDACRLNSIALTTIHPSAVYGGLNTGYGITDYMENIARRRILMTPFIIDGQFPVIHAESLADGVIRSIGKPGAYLFSDCMTSLHDIAKTIKSYMDCTVPFTLPVSIARKGTVALEAVARIGRFRPIISTVQIDYITREHIPVTGKAEYDLGWTAMTLGEGIKKYLRERLQLI